MTSTSIEGDQDSPQPQPPNSTELEVSGRRGHRRLFGLFFVLALLFLLERYINRDPTHVAVLGDAQVATCNSDLRTIETCLLRYKHNNGKLPTDAEGLQALVVAPSSASSKSPITKASCLIDPWQHGYPYRVVKTASRGYYVFSLGPDGKEGTEDDLHLP